MASINFTAGTVIPSTWLNDVNALVYGSASPPANPIRVSTTGAVTIAVPASGTTLSLAGLSTNNTLALTSTGATGTLASGWAAGIAAAKWNIYTSSTDPLVIGTQGAGSTSLATNNTERVIVDGSGIVGIGVTPSAWDSTFKVTQYGTAGSIYSNTTSTVLNYNTYFNGTNNIYSTSTFAHRLALSSTGGFQFFSAPSGTAGNTATLTQNFNIDTNGNALVTGAGGLGYGTGSGGTVTQLTNKNTTVTLNKTNGQIITSNSSLASNAVAAFTFSNTKIDPTDTIAWSIPNGSGTGGAYLVHFQPDTNAAAVYIRNLTAGALAEAITINFAVIKAKTS